MHYIYQLEERSQKLVQYSLKAMPSCLVMEFDIHFVSLHLLSPLLYVGINGPLHYRLQIVRNHYRLLTVTIKMQFVLEDGFSGFICIYFSFSGLPYKHILGWHLCSYNFLPFLLLRFVAT
ncbi:hypothetical protein SAY87_005519 [Trapa incisa]|uniref:Uncharacterized protein n=1 Tax=Trapa incisa TaxID=236973 RepID=A0AAN7KAB9_9MYRT|nr:hypothetical protein SAY87_005519 [Trapa incisa]